MRKHYLSCLLLGLLGLATSSADAAENEATAYLVVRPVICRSDDGKEPAVMRVDRERVGAVYAQAGIQLIWSEPVFFDNASARDGSIGPDQVVKMGLEREIWAKNDPGIALIFVNRILGKAGPRGLGMNPGPVCFVALPEKETEPDMEVFVTAHESTHCLGLIHVVDDPKVPNEVPNIMGDGEMKDRVGPNALHPTQIKTMRNSPLLVWKK